VFRIDDSLVGQAGHFARLGSTSSELFVGKRREFSGEAPLKIVKVEKLSTFAYYKKLIGARVLLLMST